MLPGRSDLHVAAWYPVLFGIAVPVLAVRTAGGLIGTARPLPARIVHFRGVAVSLVVLLAVSLPVAHVEFIDLFPRRLPGWRGVQTPLRVTLTGSSPLAALPSAVPSLSAV